MSGFSREELIHALPYARRYARALTGNQSLGDRLVGEALRTLSTAAPSEAIAAILAEQATNRARRLLFASLTRQFDGLPERPGAGDGRGLPVRQRQLLLLTSLEDLSIEEAAPILGLTVPSARDQLATARERLRSAAATDVLIIEDEPIIAMDIEELVENCGHRVVGVANTEEQAVQMAEQTRPGLILADINLGAGGDGTSAVARILATHAIPVIFVTAYPERLLTGEALEPAYVITKPFEPLTLAIATYQAVTGGVHFD
jgi:CheY-like chemotaxis protein